MTDYSFIFLLTRESSFIAGHLSIGNVTFYNYRSDLDAERKCFDRLFERSPPYEDAEHSWHMRASVVITGQDRASAEALAQEEVIRACDIANRYVSINHLRIMVMGIVRDLDSGEVSPFGRQWFGAEFLRGNMPNVFPLNVIRGILLKESRNDLERAVLDALSWTGRARAGIPKS